MLTPRRKSGQLKSGVAPRLGQAPRESVHGKIVRKSAEQHKTKALLLAPQKKPLAAANREPLPRADASWRVDDPQASVQEDPYGGTLPPGGGIPTPTSSPQPLHPWAQQKQQASQPVPSLHTPEELTAEQKDLCDASRAAAEDG